MNFGLYSIRDTKTEAFQAPWTSQNNNTAMRTFSDIAKNPESMVNRHPQDYCLVKVGVWNDETGQPTPGSHVTLAYGTDFNAEQKPSPTFDQAI